MSERKMVIDAKDKIWVGWGGGIVNKLDEQGKESKDKYI